MASNLNIGDTSQHFALISMKQHHHQHSSSSPPDVSESLKIKLRQQSDNEGGALLLAELDQSALGGVTLDDITKDRHMVSQDVNETQSKYGGGPSETTGDRARTPLASEAINGASIVGIASNGGRRKVGGTVIPRSKISQPQVGKITSSSIKRPSMTQTQPLPQLNAQLLHSVTLYRTLKSELTEENIEVSFGNQTVKFLPKEGSIIPDMRVLELMAKGPYQLYPPTYIVPDDQAAIFCQGENDTNIRLSMIKMQVKISTHCFIEVELNVNQSQPKVTNGDVSPPPFS